jgi:hypothetical protein
MEEETDAMAALSLATDSPTTTSHEYKMVGETISSIVGRFQNGMVNSKPSYQRGYVWSKATQQKLIDSIINKFAIPAIFLRVLDVERGNRVTQEVMDGKQRMKAILDFVEGKFKVLIRGQMISFKEMDDNDSHSFMHDRELTVVKYMHITDAQAKDIFSRLNHGVALTHGEKLQGINENVREMMKKLEPCLDKVKCLFIYGNRFGDFDYCVSCLFVHHHGLKTFTNEKLIEFISDDEGIVVTDEFTRECEENLKQLLTLLAKKLDDIKASMTKYKFVMAYHAIHNKYDMDAIITFLVDYKGSNCRTSQHHMRATESVWFKSPAAAAPAGTEIDSTDADTEEPGEGYDA